MCNGDLENEIDLDQWPADKCKMLERKHYDRLVEAFEDAAINAGHSPKAVFGATLQ